MTRQQARRKTRHHLTPKVRYREAHSKGEVLPYRPNGDENLLTLTWEHHCYWHKLFGNQTLEEIIEALQRIKKAKGRNDP